MPKKDDLGHIVEEVPILFRIWIYETKEGSRGVIDLEYPSGGIFLDAVEALIKKDEYGVFRLYSRGRGKDIPREWYPVIESSLLAPLSVGGVELWGQHLFGKGKIFKIVYKKTKFWERQLVHVQIISPKEHAKAKGLEKFRTDWANEIPRGKGASYENFQSRIFEISVANYLHREYDYYVDTRLKPSYLMGKEIDVFAERGTHPRKISVCECRLRFNDSPIKKGEIKEFCKKIRKIEKFENIRGHSRFRFFFVTNTDKLQNEVKEFAKDCGIEIQRAQLSSNWKKRADWSVTQMNKL